LYNINEKLKIKPVAYILMIYIGTTR